MRPEVKTCPACFGRGNVPKTETYTDTALSVAIGTAAGCGYMPMTRTRVVLKPCHACGGSGKAKSP